MFHPSIAADSAARHILFGGGGVAILGWRRRWN